MPPEETVRYDKMDLQGCRGRHRSLGLRPLVGRIRNRRTGSQGSRQRTDRSRKDAIRVLSATEAVSGFHPRFDAKAKTYEYRIVRAEVCSPFEWPFAHHHPYPLDEATMIAAAGIVEGEHDFSSFAAVDPEKGLDDEDRSKVRTIFSSVWKRDGLRRSHGSHTADYGRADEPVPNPPGIPEQEPG